MNQRIGLAVIVILVAAHSVYQSMSPDQLATAGVYAAASTGPAPRRFQLVLGKDWSASLRTESVDSEGRPSLETGSWFRDGSTVQVALVGDDADRTTTALTLRVTGDGLASAAEEASGSRFAGMTFVRVNAQNEPPAAN